MLGSCRYVAVTSGIIEVQRDKKRSTVSPSKQQTGKEEFERSTFDLATRQGLESYWAQLAQMAVDYRWVSGHACILLVAMAHLCSAKFTANCR